MASLSLGTTASTSDGAIALSKNTGGGWGNFRRIDDGFNFCIGDYGSLNSGNAWIPTQFSINYSTGNIEIGATGQSSKLFVNGTTYYANGTTYLNGDTARNGMVSFNNM